MEEDDRYTRITLRIPKDLHGLISAAAAETSKSMNAEIVARLQQTFTPTTEPLPVTMIEINAHLGQLQNMLSDIKLKIDDKR